MIFLLFTIKFYEMKNSFFLFFLYFFSPVFIFSQYDDSYEGKESEQEKITCSLLIKDHLDQCEKCHSGEQCYTRRDLLRFCSNKNQELLILDNGPENCNCPTYGYYYAVNQPGWGNWYNYTPYYDANYYYTGPAFRYGYGLTFGTSWNLGGYYAPAYWGYGRGSYYTRGGYGTWGGYRSRGGYNGWGGYHNHGGYYGRGGYHNNGNYNHHGSHHNQGSRHYHGSRRQ